MAFSFSNISGHPIQHGCVLFNHLWNNLYPHGCQLSKDLRGIVSCMAVSFATISGTTYPAWLSAFQTSLHHRILHGCELVNHLWNNLQPLKHVWGLPAFQASLDIQSCMDVSFSTISGIPILNGCQLFKHLSTSNPDWL